MAKADALKTAGKFFGKQMAAKNDGDEKKSSPKMSTPKMKSGKC